MTVVCVDDGNFKVSLTVGREYEVEPTLGDMYRIIDDTGEAYLYPRSLFAATGEHVG